MRLANPWLLLLLLIPLLVLVVRAVLGKRRSLRRVAGLSLGNFPVLREIPRGIRGRFWWLPEALGWAAFLALVIAAARPQTEDWEVLAGKGHDLMLCLDMSGSMNLVDQPAETIQRLAEEGKRPQNRFQVAVDTLRDLVRNRIGDRLGLVIFSSKAYLKFPLTLDRDTVLRQLDSLVLDDMIRSDPQGQCDNNCTIPGDATAVGDALSKAYKRLEKADGKGRIIILITDGNDNASELSPLDVARHIGSLPDGERPRLYTFLVGQGENSFAPRVVINPFDPSNRQVRYEPANEKVDEKQLRELTEAAHGVFHVSYNEEEFKKAFEDLQKGDYEESRVARHKDLFVPWLLLALALLGLQFLLEVSVLRRFP